MARRFLTVSELVDGCSPPNEQSRLVWIRRARDWSNAGILATARRHREGTGRHRLYNPDSVYLAAVMLRMADQGVSLRTLAIMASLLHEPSRDKNVQQLKEF